MNLEELIISTERLYLRRLKLSDAEVMFHYRADPEIYRYQNWQPSGIRDVEYFITDRIAEEPDVPGTWYQFGIFVKGENTMIGDLGIHFLEDEKQCEIGYTLASDFQGKGYALEAVKGILGYLFGSLKKHRVIGSVDPGNIKSTNLLEKIGMRKEAHFRKSLLVNGQWTDDVIYAILEEEWI